MVLMGSSEFNYGKRLIYHPRNIFRKQNMSLMTIGNVYNQSLSHAISLGAITPKLKKKKVVLLLSMSWFYNRLMADGTIS